MRLRQIQTTEDYGDEDGLSRYPVAVWAPEFPLAEYGSSIWQAYAAMLDLYGRDIRQLRIMAFVRDVMAPASDAVRVVPLQEFFRYLAVQERRISPNEFVGYGIHTADGIPLRWNAPEIREATAHLVEAALATETIALVPDTEEHQPTATDDGAREEAADERPEEAAEARTAAVEEEATTLMKLRRARAEVAARAAKWKPKKPAEKINQWPPEPVFDKRLAEYLAQKNKHASDIGDSLLHLAREQAARAKNPLPDARPYLQGWALSDEVLIGILQTAGINAVAKDGHGHVRLDYRAIERHRGIIILHVGRALTDIGLPANSRF